MFQVVCMRDAPNLAPVDISLGSATKAASAYLLGSSSGDEGCQWLYPIFLSNKDLGFRRLLADSSHEVRDFPLSSLILRGVRQPRNHSSGEVPFFLDRGPKRNKLSPATFLPYEENVRLA